MEMISISIFSAVVLNNHIVKIKQTFVCRARNVSHFHMKTLKIYIFQAIFVACISFRHGPSSKLKQFSTYLISFRIEPTAFNQNEQSVKY